MAALIDPLASGLVGCAGGTVTIYQRGTTTPAIVYTGYDEVGPTTGSLGVHVLDANGAIVLYTIEPLAIVCKSNLGAIVRTITYQGHAGNIEVKQAGYNSAASTNVKEVLSDLQVSLGGNDGEVVVNGAPSSVTDAISAVAIVSLNVKAFGAVGNGVVDDLSAIQTAIYAGYDTGSPFEVYFPEGNYNVSAALLTQGSCTLRGVEPSSSVIQSTSSSAAVINLSGIGLTISSMSIGRSVTVGAATGHTIVGAAPLTLKSARISGGNASSTGHCIYYAFGSSVSATADSRLSNSGSGDIINVGSGAMSISLDGSSFALGSSTGRFVYSTSTTSALSASRTTFTASSSATPADDLIDIAGECRLTDCAISTSQASGTKYLIKANAAAQVVRLMGNKFTGLAGTTYVLRLNTAAGASRSLYELGNILGSTVSWYEATATPAITTVMATPGMDSAVQYYETSSGTQVLAANFGRHVMRHTGGGTLQFSCAAAVRHTGRRISVTYTNASGGTVTPSFLNTDFATGFTVPAVANGSSITMDFVYTTSGKYQMVGGNPIATA